MNSPSYARLAALLLAQESLPAVEPSYERRAHAVDVIARALIAKTHRRVRRVWAAGLAAIFAAGLLGYVGVRQLPHPTRVAQVQAVSAVVESSGNSAAILSPAGSRALLSPAQLQQGGRLVAGASGGATVELSTGTRLAVEHDTNLEFESAGPVERFFLAQGVLYAKVAKLVPGQRFIVRTPDAEVEVRGTTFRVTIVAPDADCGGGTLTRVSVDDGLVEVRGAGASTYVHPSENWPAHCAASLPVGIVAPQVALPAPSGSKTVARAISAERAPGSPSRPAELLEPSRSEASNIAPPRSREVSSIAQQNELFSEAMAARRLGDRAGALRSFELFVVRYPTSPLVESAVVHRLLLLRSIDPLAAQTAAHDYLSRYPGGYAKNDAEKLLSQP